MVRARAQHSLLPTGVLLFQSVSFTAYLINTYESESRYSQPLLRSYIAFDYSDLANNLHSLRPFIGTARSIRLAI